MESLDKLEEAPGPDKDNRKTDEPDSRYTKRWRALLMAYIDTSVLVAYYCPEPLSDQVEAILLNTERPAISQLTEVEFISALTRKIRGQMLTTGDGGRR